ncbi:hypothetical protein GFS24_03055 [Chitinophaga sp. SYP-B3965]|uniref:hypothetical protein n=1 Tax=Chitinophaga sp. SYP-B3965 TaxID=2663120 RepID=UPI001299F32C|nr:hypothetical protein [Chitinophaga sp. SYP-B3965]MRG44072.1 hypothetical protein [Chitinophaga sp. SYP-B3965]
MKMKWKPSDVVVILLGALGFFLGLMGLINPDAQYSMMGITASSLPADSVIPGLFGSGSLSAIYVGIIYIYGVLKKWDRFKAYLIFARMVMCLGFLVLVCIGRAPQAFIPAAAWEGAGALFILLALWWDKRHVK